MLSSSLYALLKLFASCKIRLIFRNLSVWSMSCRHWERKKVLCPTTINLKVVRSDCIMLQIGCTSSPKFPIPRG